MMNCCNTINVPIFINDAYTEIYSSGPSEWNELGGKFKANNIIEVCKKINRPRKVLEVGAGDGSILKFLDKNNFTDELYALEISPSGVECIKSRKLASLKSVKQFNGYTIPFEDDFFDLVVLSHVIEHVEYPRALIREIKRVSKYQVVEIPCDYSGDVDQKVDHFLSYGHINIYTPPLLKFFLKSEGLKIIYDRPSPMPVEISTFINTNYDFFVNAYDLKNSNKELVLKMMEDKQKQLEESIKNETKFRDQFYTVLCEKLQERPMDKINK